MILIFSNSYDYPTVNPVYKQLKAAGENVILYLSDYVAAGKVEMGLTISQTGEALFHYDGRTFGSEDILAAWIRRPDVFTDEEPKQVKIISINKQRSLCQKSLLYCVNKAACSTIPPTCNLITMIKSSSLF